MTTPPTRMPSPPSPAEDDARTRRILWIAAVGAVANAAWLVHSALRADLLAAALSGIGLAACALPTVLCVRRLARRDGRADRRRG